MWGTTLVMTRKRKNGQNTNVTRAAKITDTTTASQLVLTTLEGNENQDWQEQQSFMVLVRGAVETKTSDKGNGTS